MDKRHFDAVSAIRNLRNLYTSALLFLMLAFMAGVIFPSPNVCAQKVAVGERSASGVSITFHDGKYFLAWTGEGGRIYVMRSDEGVDWRAKIALDEQSSHPPDIASNGEHLYLAWVGKDSGNLYTIRSRDGVDWRNKVRLDERSDAAPSIAVSDSGQMLLVWKSADTKKMNVIQTRDGVDWRAKVKLDETTSQAPAVAYFYDHFYLSWTGSDKEDIYVMRSRGGVDWTAKIRLDERSNTGPSIAVYNDRLYLGWTSGDKGDIYVMSSREGIDWRNKVKTGSITPAPVRLSGGHKLVLGYQTNGSIMVSMSRDGVDF